MFNFEIKLPQLSLISVDFTSLQTTKCLNSVVFICAEHLIIIADKNIERLLRNTHISVDAADQRRFDLVVPGLKLVHGFPLFCDMPIITPI